GVAGGGAQGAGVPLGWAWGRRGCAGGSRWQGQFGRARDLASQAAAALDRAGPIADSQLDPHLIRANCLFDLDRDAEAQEAYTADLRLAERGVGTFFLCLHHLSVARMCFLTGRWDDALSEISAAREAPDHLGVGVHLDGLAALVAVHGRIATHWRRCGRRSIGRWPVAPSGTRSTTGPGGADWPCSPTVTPTRRSACCPTRGRNASPETANSAVTTCCPTWRRWRFHLVKRPLRGRP